MSDLEVDSDDVLSITINEGVVETLKSHSIATSFSSKPRFQFGKVLKMSRNATFERFSSILQGDKFPMHVGAFTYMNSAFPTGVDLGRYCSIGRGINVMGDPHPLDRLTSSPVTYHHGLPVMKAFLKEYCPEGYPVARFDRPRPIIHIEHDVWIGNEAIISRGVRLGTGCVVAARAIVTRDVEPYEIVGGIPAKRIRYRFEKDQRDALLASEWWKYSPDVLAKADPTNIDRFIETFSTLIEQNNLQPFEPGSLSAVHLFEASQQSPA